MTKQAKTKRVTARAVAVPVVTVVWLVPIIWTVVTSFKSRPDVIAFPPVFRFQPVLSNFADVLSSADFYRALFNSASVAGTATVLILLLALLAAYGLSKFEFRAANGIASFIISIRFMPVIAAVLPIYVLYRQLHLIDTRIGLILLYTAYGLPFAVWLLMDFVRGIPREVDEAASLDGCNHWQCLWKITFPLALPGLAVTAIFTFLFAWNEYIFAVILTGSQVKTFPIFLTTKYATKEVVSWGQLSAASILFIIPIFAVIFYLQKDIARGLSLGATR